MMRTTVETAGEDGGDGDGPGGSPMNALTVGVLGAITPRQRSDTPYVEQTKMLADHTMADILARKAGGWASAEDHPGNPGGSVVRG